MALKAYTLDLALQTSSEFAIGNTIPNVAGIATDGKGFIPTKNSINKTITLSKGFGKFGGRLFELTEQTVYSWDAGSTDADAYLVIDLTKQNSFTGTIEDGTYTFVDNQSSIVISSAQPEPSANALVYKLDGNYQTENSRSVSDLSVLGNVNVSGTIYGRGGQRIFDNTTLDSLNVTNPINGQLAVEPINLLYNTNFNNNAEGWLKMKSNTTWQVQPTGVLNYMKITSPSAWQGVIQYINVEPNNPSPVNVSAELSAFVGNTSLYVGSYDQNKTLIGRVDLVGQVKTTDTGWVKLNKDFTPASGTYYIGIAVQPNVDNGVAGFMKPQITFGTGNKPYVRGSEMQDMTSGTSDASFRNLNVSGVVNSSKNYIEFGKPISTPVISGTVTMWYGWKVYYHVQNGMVTYQFQTTDSTIPAGTFSNEKLPKAAIPLYKTFVPLAYGGQGFAINVDGSFENYTGTSISGASWASASSHVLNQW